MKITEIEFETLISNEFMDSNFLLLKSDQQPLKTKDIQLCYWALYFIHTENSFGRAFNIINPSKGLSLSGSNTILI